jgi:2-methylcitrate dehydratase PrpD
VGADEVGAAGLGDARVARLVAATVAVEDLDFSRRFPAERWGRVRIALDDGRTFVSEPTQARGGEDSPLTDAELKEKYRSLAEPVLGPQRTARIARSVEGLAHAADASAALLDDLLSSTS